MYNRCIDVAQSCNTIEQARVALKYNYLAAIQNLMTFKQYGIVNGIILARFTDLNKEQ